MSHSLFLRPNPQFQTNGTFSGALPPPEYKDMSPTELAALAAELEPAAVDGMQEIDDLQQKGITHTVRYVPWLPLSFWRALRFL